MKESDSVLELAYQMGEILLKNGAEISRVQETMERVAKAYNAEDFNVYVLTNAIFANGSENGDMSKAKLSNIRSTSIHLGRISAVNQLSREIAEGKYSVEEALAKLDEIRTIPYSRSFIAVLACGVGSACFSYLFGGTFFDALAAMLCGFILEIYLYFSKKNNMSKFLENLSSSALMAVCALILVFIGLGNNTDKVIIGSIIRLVPGVALTTSIRDFFNGDYLSGTIRMIDALLVGGCIAVGVGVVIKLFSMITGGAPL